MPTLMHRHILAAALCTAGLASHVRAQAPLKYPATRKDATTDNYFGARVADPYRWLEDQNSAEVAHWVDAENKVTFDYLAKIPLRATFRAELTKLINVPRVSVPFRVANNFSIARTPAYKTNRSCSSSRRSMARPAC